MRRSRSVSPAKDCWQRFGQNNLAAACVEGTQFLKWSYVQPGDGSRRFEVSLLKPSRSWIWLAASVMQQDPFLARICSLLPPIGKARFEALARSPTLCYIHSSSFMITGRFTALV